MAWETEMVEILRIMINDMDVPYRYSDVRLQKIIVAGAQTMMAEVGNRFITIYTTDIATPDITPDPCDRTSGARDEDFINLTLLKSACFIDNCVARDAARKGGVSIREWATSLDTKGLFTSAMSILQNGWCKTYEESMFQFLVGNSSVCTAVLGPFRTYHSAGYYYGGGELVNRHWR